MSGDRDEVLRRIGEALVRPAKHLHAPHPVFSSESEVESTSAFREWLPPVGASLEERITLFKKQSAALKSEVTEHRDIAAAAAEVTRLAHENGWRKLAIQGDGVFDELQGLLPAELSIVKIEIGYDRFELESCDAGLTGCECLVAQTGSVCVTSSSSGGRTLSVLPPHHLVLVKRSQIEPDLLAAYELLHKKYGTKLPSFVGFITGPSRTGDIERILVLGAHGPKRLSILIVE